MMTTMQRADATTDRREDSRRPVLSGKWRRRKVNLLCYPHSKKENDKNNSADAFSLFFAIKEGLQMNYDDRHG